MVSETELRTIMPHLSAAKAQEYLPFLQAAMTEYDIMTPLREAAFLAQIAHESAELKYFEEIWGPSLAQRRYDPAYKDPNGKLKSLAPRLGNTQAGDGYRYRGRGPVQLTGRANYRSIGKAIGVDLENNPDLAADPSQAFRIAGAFWKIKKLNQVADTGNFAKVTSGVNGGTNGEAARNAYYAVALSCLSTDDPKPIRVVVDGEDKTGTWLPFMKDGLNYVALGVAAPILGHKILVVSDTSATLRPAKGADFTVPILMINGHGFCPISGLRAKKVEWDGANRTVKVTTG